MSEKVETTEKTEDKYTLESIISNPEKSEKSLKSEKPNIDDIISNFKVSIFEP